MRTRSSRSLAAVALCVATLAVAAPALAFDQPEPTKPPPSEPQTPLPPGDAGQGGSGAGSGDASSSGGSRAGQVRNCSIVSSPSYLGVACGSADGGGLTVKEILGSDPVPGCWDDALTASELAAMGLVNRPGRDGSAWYWERCLKGIDHKTKTVEPGGVSFTIGLESIRNGEPVRTLTERQQRLVRFQGVDRQIPDPVAGVSPGAHPRVGAWVSFFDGSPTEVTASGGGSVVLRARVVSLEVKPLGADEPEKLTCPGTGVRAAKGDTPSSEPRGCWFRYPESSSAQPDQKVPVQMVAHWQVDVSANGAAGPFTPFNSFTKSQVTTVPVTEIQAIVVN